MNHPRDIVLDFHLGSGTTAAVAHKLGFQYVGIEQIDYGENDSVVRLNNVINGDQSGISKLVGWKGGGEFIYTELAKWNEKAKELIISAKNTDALIGLFDVLYEKYFLNYTVKAKEFREKIIKEAAYLALPFDQQKKMFLEMLDLNQLYVNYSERNDKNYQLPAADISLTEEFYNGE